VGPGLPHPFTGAGIGLSGLRWMFGAIFFPRAYLTRLFIGLLGGLWACWLLFAFGCPCWLLFAFGVSVQRKPDRHYAARACSGRCVRLFLASCCFWRCLDDPYILSELVVINCCCVSTSINIVATT
jgi:hypothetical protein